MVRPLYPYLRTFIINKRRFHTNNCLFDFYEPPRSGYPAIYEDPPLTQNKSFLEKLKLAFTLAKSECKLFAKEVRDSFHVSNATIASKYEDVVFKFDGTEQSLKQWIVNYDSLYNEGFSTAKLELSPFGTGIFHGVLNTTVPKDGRMKRSGYCNITTVPKYRSFRRKGYYDWSKYNELVLRVRGDGRAYMINILQKGYFDVTWNDMYNYVMYTRGGPYWQVIKIPFAKFVFSEKGIVQDYQCPLPETMVTNLGITVADKKPGPFRLEIDYIAVSFDEFNLETSAYEFYDVRK